MNNESTFTLTDDEKMMINSLFANLSDKNYIFCILLNYFHAKYSSKSIRLVHIEEFVNKLIA